jgi:acetyl esterase/lipase
MNMKNNFSKIHPELQQIAKKTPKINFGKNTLWLVNLLMALIPTPKTPQDVIIENTTISGQNEQTKVRLRIYKPKSISTPTPVLIWLHGGGYVMGTPKMDDLRCTEYVRELGITVVSVNYRRAPKHPFPAALDDSYTALKWVAAQAQQLNIDAQRTAVGDFLAACKKYNVNTVDYDESDLENEFRQIAQG